MNGLSNLIGSLLFLSIVGGFLAVIVVCGYIAVSTATGMVLPSWLHYRTHIASSIGG